MLLQIKFCVIKSNIDKVPLVLYNTIINTADRGGRERTAPLAGIQRKHTGSYDVRVSVGVCVCVGMQI